MDAVGTTLSYVRLRVDEAVFPLPAESAATPAASEADTVPCADGVRLKVYVVPLPEKPLMVQFVSVTSVEMKPVTDSLNVAVTAMGEVFVGFGALEVSETVGAVLSIV